MDDWLRIRASAPTAVLVKKLRAALDALLESKARPWVASAAGVSKKRFCYKCIMQVHCEVDVDHSPQRPHWCV